MKKLLAKEIGDRLRAYRNHLQMTQREYAKQLRLPPSTYVSREYGNIEMSLYLFAKLCYRAGLNSHWLLTGQGAWHELHSLRELPAGNKAFAEKIGVRLHEMRTLRYWSVLLLDYKLYHPVPQVQKMEEGKMQIPLATFARIVTLLNVDAEFFLWGCKSEEKAEEQAAIHEHAA